jgi:hypothetical protein
MPAVVKVSPRIQKVIEESIAKVKTQGITLEEFNKRYPSEQFDVAIGGPIDNDTIELIRAHKSSKGGGIKHDQSKPPIHLLSGIADKATAEVLAFGAKKYAEHNWRKGMDWTRLLRAAKGHIQDFIDGEDKDPESGLSHLSHAACCIMFLQEYEQTHKELDNRYKKEV